MKKTKAMLEKEIMELKVKNNKLIADSKLFLDGDATDYLDYDYGENAVIAKCGDLVFEKYQLKEVITWLLSVLMVVNPQEFEEVLEEMGELKRFTEE